MSEPEKQRFLLLNTSTVPPGGFRYIQPETEKLISASNWNALKANVAQHRKANGLPIGTDFEAELQDWLCRRLPDAGMHCYERGKLAVRSHNVGNTPIVGTGYQGQDKWMELHTYALTERPTPLGRVAWLANFADSLPCGECKQSWKVLMRQAGLPQGANDTEFFNWTVDRHNDVNRKLGKRVLSHEEARALYL
jgi:hypothetical protein